MHAQSFDFLKEVVADVPDPVGDTDALPSNSGESGAPPTSRGRGRRPKGSPIEPTQGTSVFNAASTGSSHGDIHSEVTPISVAGIKREGAEIDPEASNYHLLQQHSTSPMSESDPHYSNTPLSNTRANTMSITSVINVTSNEDTFEKGPTRSRKR
jgi:hypothetical protein